MAFSFKSFAKRAGVALVGGPALVAIFHYGGYALLTLLVLIIIFGQWEFYRMARTKGYAPARFIGTVAGVAVALLVFTGAPYLAVLLTGTVTLLFLREIGAGRRLHVVEDIGISLFGVVYVAYLPSHLLLFHARSGAGIPGGALWLPVILVSIWVFDTFCYLAGSWLGKHKLFPTISPGKTWEGLIGGIIALMALSPLLFIFIGEYATGYDYLAVPMLVAVAALGGDLFESILKRDCGVKDSSAIIPGHGGVLDRFDSMFFVIPVLYWYLLLTKGVAG